MLYDKDIREPLFDFLEARYEKVRIIEEKQMGRSRADIVMVLPEALVGIEIKSDADTYARLARQVQDYDRYFDANYVVAGTSHAMHIEEHVPEYWGIITVEEEGGEADFYMLRHARENAGVDWERKLGLLWRSELGRILEKNMLPRYVGKSRRYAAQKILERVPREILRAQISEELFERDYQELARELEERRHMAKPRKRRKSSKKISGFHTWLIC